MTAQGQDESLDALGVQPGKLRSMKPRELLVRFAFGAGVSLLAAIVSTVAGPRVGGLFLAFPAILLASLTMMARKEGLHRARDDCRGAALGTLGLFAVARVGALTLPRWPAAAALTAACVAWLVVSLAAYAVVRAAGAGGDEPEEDEPEE
jgi:uncharacterized membrane protein (GlpM family)